MMISYRALKLASISTVALMSVPAFAQATPEQAAQAAEVAKPDADSRVRA